MKSSIATLTLLIIVGTLFGQSDEITQVIRGTIVDEDANSTIFGANVVIVDSDPIIGVATDENGEFKLEDVPIGRVGLKITALGYEPKTLQNLQLTSGKELVLNIKLTESLQVIEEVEIKATGNSREPLNEMAAISARSFSVEETQRYAASGFDPSRMALAYAGVSYGGGSDLFNEISVRGNSPRGMLWRLEGIEIPNPNHFGSMGSSGGAISMLSSSTLSTSDFYTGAFPAEFGNASSGVFDLRMRNGNNETREHSFMVGALGVEASTEGYFSKESRASYLLNYRYSTLALISIVSNPVGDVLPAYQDFSFKLNVPTKSVGTFSLFGLGGANTATVAADRDSTLWESDDDAEDYEESQLVGVVGLSHKWFLSDRTYLRTVAAVAYDNYKDESSLLDASKNYEGELFDVTTFENQTLRLSTMLNHKFNNRHTLRIGAIGSRLSYNFKYDNKDLDTDIWTNFVNQEGESFVLQGYGQWKFRLNESWTLNGGVHATYLDLNQTYGIDPRASIQWQLSPGQSLSAAVGLHSKPEHVSTYLLERDGMSDNTPNINLKMPRSTHYVLGYKRSLSEHVNINIEAYYQQLDRIAVERDPNSDFSIVNTSDIWDIIDTDSLVSEGSGTNMGVDVSIERRLANDYYWLVSGSVFDSKYKGQNGIEYNTRYNANYTLNLLGGKEFPVGKNKKNTVGLNGRFMLSGGNRETPIDLTQSAVEEETVRMQGSRFSQHVGTYYRFDIGFSYKFNRPKTTHTILVDLQNVSNRENVWFNTYDSTNDRIEPVTQTGLFPFFNYRIEFQGKSK